MRKKTIYVCEICGIEYSDKDKAEMCENSHKLVLTLPREKIKPLYKPISEDPSGKPYVIDIDFGDGMITEYWRNWRKKIE